uniref:Uncharacterized protein n=1 Tax=Cannabis sativa TaxID=3483 RepID=A0A803PCI8_CANSA
MDRLIKIMLVISAVSALHMKPPSLATPYCPPPPASLLYITGPPGDQLYPIDPDYTNDAGKSISLIEARLPVLIGSGLLAVLALW